MTSLRTFLIFALSASFTLAGAVRAAPVAEPDVGVPGSVVLTFDGSGGAPDVYTSPTLNCTGPVRSGGAWQVDCEPRLLATSAAAPQFVCRNPVGLAGGTPVTMGQAFVRVGCGPSSATCTATWSGQGQCLATLPGTHRFPLKCAGDAQGTSVGGFFYAQCIVLT